MATIVDAYALIKLFLIAAVLSSALYVPHTTNQNTVHYSTCN